MRLLCRLRICLCLGANCTQQQNDMQQPLRRSLCEARGRKDSVARIVAKIPPPAVREHDSQIRCYILSEECCDGFISEKVAEIL